MLFSLKTKIASAFCFLLLMGVGFFAMAQQVIITTDGEFGGFIIGQSKQQIFDELVDRPDVLSVWPSTISRDYINRDNIDNIEVLADADMLVISGLGVFINVQIDNKEIWEIEDVTYTSTSRQVLEALPIDDINMFLDVLGEFILDGTVDGVQSVPRKNPNNDRAVVSTTVEPNANTEIDLEWLFSYDRWDFTEENKGTQYILIFDDGALRRIEYHS